MRTYLTTSRDGAHFDLDWVYAEQEIVPHGKCRPQPYCIAARRQARTLGVLFKAVPIAAGALPPEELP